MSVVFGVLWLLSTIVAVVITIIFASRKSDREKLLKILIGFWIASVVCFIGSVATPKTPEPVKTPITETKTLTPEEQAKKDADDALAKKQADEARAKQEAEAKAQAEAKAEATKLLDASVQKIFSAPAGIQVTNNENNTWYGCKFVLNDKYTKQYRDDQGIASGESEALTIPYALFLKSDGTRFDYATTAPTSFLISCKVNGNTRNNVYTF